MITLHGTVSLGAFHSDGENQAPVVRRASASRQVFCLGEVQHSQIAGFETTKSFLATSRSRSLIATRFVLSMALRAI